MNNSVSTVKLVRLGAVLVLVVAALAVGGSGAAVGRADAAVNRRPAVAPQPVCERNLGNLTAAGTTCATSTATEFIWRGRIHLGDEPGIYADAVFSGLTTEFPITLLRSSAPGPDTTTLIVETEEVQTFSGYPGHLVTVYIHVPDPAAEFHSKQVVLKRARITSADNNRKEITVDLGGYQPPYYISVQVRQDVEVPPGALDDFVVTRLSNRSQDFRFIANFGYVSTVTD